MAFSDNLQQIRKKANISQEKLAEQLHISRQAVSKWESAQSVPDADTCLRLCEILGVSPNQLLLGEDNKNTHIPCYQNNYSKISDYAVFTIFLMVVLICGTALLICNLYNGNIFEPYMHTMALLLIKGAIIVFICSSVFRFIKMKRNNKIRSSPTHLNDF